MLLKRIFIFNASYSSPKTILEILLPSDTAPLILYDYMKITRVLIMYRNAGNSLIFWFEMKPQIY